MALSINNNGVILKVKLTPKAARDAIVRIDTDAEGNQQLRASVTAVPEKGKANSALVKMLSKKLGLPKTSIRLIAGEQSRHKTVHFDGDPDELMEKLTAKFSGLGLMG